MKISIKPLITFLIAIAIISCGPEAKNKTDANEEHPEENHHNKEGDLKLNAGSKWIANAETTEGVNNMIKIMDSFSDQDNIEAYKVLSEKLQTEFNMIFKKCTMKGESHNQLHNFLVPMKSSFREFNSNELSSCKSSFNELRIHLDKYKEFFQ